MSQNQNKNNLSANKAWEKLIDTYDIVNKIADEGCFHIKASEIKEFKEPRLMAKWDSSDSLPEVLRKNKINILPNSRSSYVLSDFLLYQEIPELSEHVTQMEHIDIPVYESIDVNSISSEANAINVLIISGILDDFLGTDENVSTFNGRMGTGEFDFKVDTTRGISIPIHVDKAQCEIDVGLENNDSVVIMEAKNVVHEDFHVRQLYYPYRLWKTRVNKPIRTIFSVYSNKIYRLFEYKFVDINNYSSIELVQMKNYSLQDTQISLEDLIVVRKDTTVLTSDPYKRGGIPFLQANSMARVISLLENLYDNPMSENDIAELMQFEVRQSGYYFNAGRYLGLFEKVKDDNETYVVLTKLGKDVFKLEYKDRQLKLVSLLLEHQIFADFFDYVIENGEIPDSKLIINKMREYNVCGESQIIRRSSSVSGWLKWVFNLTKL